MEKTTDFKKNKGVSYNCKSPLLFIIPSDVYADDMEKERDKESFLKIQKLAKKCEQLRQKLHLYSEQQSARMETTRNLVIRTMEVTINSRGRRVRF